MTSTADRPAAPIETARKTPRDPRLDFFRGLGMFIILYAHIPNGELVNWIPARFGFSDATEIFVCCSGFASAYAFGRVFDIAGWRVGATRIAYRIWQVYWGHIGVFVVIVAMLGAIDARLGTKFAGQELNLAPFLADPGAMMAHFMTLTYVPNFFDILPMYLVILAMVPVAMAIARFSLVAVAAVSILLWFAADIHLIELLAEPWSDRPWYFNPFAWQLVFFTGFGFGMRWWPAPPRDRRLVIASIVVLVAAVPFACHFGFRCYAWWGYSPWLGDAHDAIQLYLSDKSHLGIFRYIHFLALAYLSYLLAGERGGNLTGWFVEAMMRVGRQTLAVFMSGLVIAQLLGVVLAEFGDNALTQVIVNAGGSVALYCVAITVDYFKNAGARKNPPPPRRAPVKSSRSGKVEHEASAA